jgi:high-affinity Fe2+/Pb2+ permease
VWGGAVVTVLALVGLAVYLAEIGLGKANELSSVIGVFVAVVGLVMSGYGMVRERRRASSAATPAPPGTQPQAVKRQINVARDNATLYTVMDGTMNIEQDGSGSPRRANRDITSRESDADPGGA